jgi:hypothetical protein
VPQLVAGTAPGQVGVHQACRARRTGLHAVTSLTQPLQDLGLADGERGLEAPRSVHLGQIQNGVDQARSTTRRRDAGLYVKRGANHLSLVMLLNIGRGHSTTIDVDIDVDATILAVHD